MSVIVLPYDTFDEEFMSLKDSVDTVRNFVSKKLRLPADDLEILLTDLGVYVTCP